MQQGCGDREAPAAEPGGVDAGVNLSRRAERIFLQDRRDIRQCAPRRFRAFVRGQVKAPCIVRLASSKGRIGRVGHGAFIADDFEAADRFGEGRSATAVASWAGHLLGFYAVKHGASRVGENDVQL